MPNEIDPQVKALTQAIGEAETGPTSPAAYTKHGASGEFGRYQFMPDTYKNYAQKYLGDANAQPSVENQNKIAYSFVKEKKDAGYNPAQIASMWNAGEGKPNAYKENYKGVNEKGVAYDTPAYAAKVSANYQRLKGEVAPDQSQTIAGANVAQAAGTNPQPKDDRSLLQKGVDFAFPILSDIGNVAQGKNTKTPGQILGDTALSALWFVPGLGEVGEGALRGLPLAAKVLGEGGLKTGGQILGGGAVGYGADVGSKLAGGETDPGKVLTPGLGTVTGGLAGGLFSKIGNAITKNTTQGGAIKALQNNIDETLMANKPGRRLVNAAKAEGHNPAELIARSGAVPDVVDGKFSTVDAQSLLRKRIAGLGEARAEALDTMGTGVKINDLQKAALEATKDPRIIASGQSGRIQQGIKRLFADFKKNYGSTLSVPDLEKIKEAQAEASGIYRRTGQIGDHNASSIIGNIARGKIEDIADQSGFSGMKEFNNYIKAHYRAIEALEKIEGQPVKGGRLGNMLRGHAAGTAAAITGNTIGGPIGGVGGFLAAEAANKVLSKILGDTQLSNPLRDSILRRIQEANPKIVDELLKFTGESGKKVAPLLTPKGSGQSGLIPQLIGQGIGRSLVQPSSAGQ